MAVAAPSAPAAPVPPTVPKVTLGGAGSVTESTVPQSGYHSDASRQEMQARQAVARGDGPLTKEENETPQQAASGDSKPAAEAETKADSRAGQQPAPGAGGDAFSQEQQTAAETIPAGPSPVHGTVYWGAALAVVFAAAFVLFRMFLLRRKNGRGIRLTAADLREALQPAAGEEDLPDLRGLTPDEVLSRLDEQDRKRIRQERKEARARWKAAGYPQRETAPAAAVPRHAARQYRNQLVAMPPEEKPKPQVKRPLKREDEDHFEVRI